MGNNQSEIDKLKKDARAMEESFEQWTRKQNIAHAEEERERDTRLQKKLETIANQMKKMEIDREKKADEQAEAKEKNIREERKQQDKLRYVGQDETRIQNIATLRSEIIRMKPGESFEFPDENIPFPKRHNIGLYGATGVGKTSLMNSLKFAVNGVLKESHREQAAPASFQGSHTTRRMAVRVTKYLTFVDNRGVAAEDLVKDSAAEELIIQLGEWIQSQCYAYTVPNCNLLTPFFPFRHLIYNPIHCFLSLSLLNFV